MRDAILDAALRALASHPAYPRLRELCLDDSDPERRDGYRDTVVSLARGEVTFRAQPPLLDVNMGDLPPTHPCCPQ